METRIAIVGIIVENPDSVENLTKSCTIIMNLLLAEWAFLITNEIFQLLVL